MKVLWIGHFLPWPLRGGSLLRSYHLAREAAREYEVSFLALNNPALLPTGKELAEALEALRRHCVRVAAVPMERGGGRFGRERLVVRSLWSRSYDEHWLASEAFRRAVVNERDAFRPDVVHLDTAGLLEYARPFDSEPIVVNHHNVESQMMERRAARRSVSPVNAVLRLQARRLRNLEKQAAERADLQLAVSELDAERLRTIAPGAPVVVVPNGVDVDFFRPNAVANAAAPSLVFVGGLNWYPNVDAVRWFLTEVFPLIVAEEPSSRFTVVGKEPPADLRALASSDPRIVFTGEIDDIRPVVSASTVYVCPMREGGGTRLKILDALAQGIPLVATTMAIEGIPVRDGEHALLRDGAEAFAGATVKLIRDRPQGQRLAAAGRDLVVKEFSWESVGRRLRDAYAQARSEKERRVRNRSGRR